MTLLLAAFAGWVALGLVLGVAVGWYFRRMDRESSAVGREVTVCEMGSVGGRQDGWEADRSPACCGGLERRVSADREGQR